MAEVKPKGPRRSMADELFDSVNDVTPVKRARPTNNIHQNQQSLHRLGGLSPNLASPSRPIASGPNRLNSSPSVITSSSSPAPSSLVAPASPAIPFQLRPDRLKTQESLNAHLFVPNSNSSSLGSKSRITLFSAMDPKKFQYRYQFERMMERSQVLDSTIDDMGAEIVDFYAIHTRDGEGNVVRTAYEIGPEFADPAAQSQEDVFVVGRLCPEGEGVKMTETSTWLETSRTLGSGARILLKFVPGMTVKGASPGSGGVGMFPGCIVALKGRNGGGKLFSVSQIWMMPPPDPSYTHPSILLDHQYGSSPKQLGGLPMSVLVAAGPYTVDADLEYEPFAALIDQAIKEKPDVLILLGPFIDSQHPRIAIGDVQEFPTQIFKSKISSRLHSLVSASPRTTVLIIPSSRDLTSSHVAYPQSPLTRDVELGLPKGQYVKLLSNPATFSINEIVFGVTSLDVLFHLRNQEFFKKCGEEPPAALDSTSTDIFGRTCRHLLRQKSYYPLFPSPLPGKGIEPVNLDITHNDLVRMPTGPDVVIVPSMLKSFAKVVDSTIMLNPSHLTKANGAGTFARLSVYPMERGELERRVDESLTKGLPELHTEDNIEHRVWERCRVDIVKI